MRRKKEEEVTEPNGEAEAKEPNGEAEEAKPETSDEKTEEAMDAEGEENGVEEEGEEEECEEEEEGDEDKENDAGSAEDPDRTADEDVSNLQLAWEILELAKVIFLRGAGAELQLKAAEAHLRLGEVLLETEQHERAAEDFSACLALRELHLEADSRLVAETCYQ